MAIYSQAVVGTATLTNNPYADLKASSANAPRVMEWGFVTGTTTFSVYGLGRPGNDGSVVQTTPVLMQAENPADPAAQSGMAVAWTTAPTAPVVDIRRSALGSTVGWGIIWQFPRGLVVPASKGLVQWLRLAGPATSSCWVVVDE